MTKSTMFNVHNASDNWIIAVDDKAIRCDNKEQADALWAQVDLIDDSCFMAMCIIPPRHYSVNVLGEVATQDISDIATFVRPEYIEVRQARARKRFELSERAKRESETARDRLTKIRANREWMSWFAFTK